MTNVRPSNFAGMACSLSIWSKAVAEDPGRMAAAGSGRTGRAITGGKLHGASVHGQERRIVMALTVAGFVAGEMKIDTAEAMDVYYPGFSSGWQGWGRGQRLGERGTLRIFAIYF